MLGDILVVTLGRRWVEARDVVKQPTRYRTAPHSKKLSAPNVNSAEVEKF